MGSHTTGAGTTGESTPGDGTTDGGSAGDGAAPTTRSVDRGRKDLAFPTDVLQITAWADPVIDQLGHDPRSTYVERFWLGILGPSTTWLLRSLAHRLDREPDGFALDLAELARTLGLGTKGGQQSPFMRAIGRTCQFGLAHPVDAATLAVRRRLPPLSRRQIERLPDSLRAAHERWNDRGAPAASATELRTRAKRLALTLVDLGEDFEATERQLHRWRFHPALAHEATAWAWDHRRAGDRPTELADLSGDAA